MENKIESTRYLEEFIEFCQSDLKNPSSIEKVKWIKSLETLLYPRFFVLNVLEPTDKDWSKVLSVQQELLEFLNWIVNHLGEEGELHFMAPFAFGWATGKRPNSFFLQRPSTARWMMPSKKLEIRVSKPPQSAIQVHWGVVNFFEALKRFPTSSLSRCPHCGNVFFNPTKRKKIYCSPLCQNTAGVQRLRKKRKN